nr:response regulator transcription factor [Cytophagales bacterium]
MNKTTVLLADDHTLMRNGLRSVLEGFAEIEIVGEASNGQEAVEMTKALLPNVLLVDIAMPLLNGIQVVQMLSKEKISTRCLVLSMHNNEDYILKAAEAGAAGYLLKDSTLDDIHTALRTVAQGEMYFSPAVSGVIVQAYLNKRPAETNDAPKEKRNTPSRKEQVVLRYIV